MELLSPAGNREALIAAIACGADAVYLGYTAFGARSYAGNFDADGLHEAVEYAHERGKKIYVTVNTLVKQCETDDLCDVLDLLSGVHVDAVLVQDMGVVRIIQEHYPQLVLHASTQMTINNAQGAQLMKNMGFARVVPARECSLEELRKMADIGIEVEAFAHGRALCGRFRSMSVFQHDRRAERQSRSMRAALSAPLFARRRHEWISAVYERFNAHRSHPRTSRCRRVFFQAGGTNEATGVCGCHYAGIPRGAGCCGSACGISSEPGDD